MEVAWATERQLEAGRKFSEGIEGNPACYHGGLFKLGAVLMPSNRPVIAHCGDVPHQHAPQRGNYLIRLEKFLNESQNWVLSQAKKNSA